MISVLIDALPYLILMPIVIIWAVLYAIWRCLIINPKLYPIKKMDLAIYQGWDDPAPYKRFRDVVKKEFGYDIVGTHYEDYYFAEVLKVLKNKRYHIVLEKEPMLDYQNNESDYYGSLCWRNLFEKIEFDSQISLPEFSMCIKALIGGHGLNKLVIPSVVKLSDDRDLRLFASPTETFYNFRVLGMLRYLVYIKKDEVSQTIKSANDLELLIRENRQEWKIKLKNHKSRILSEQRTSIDLRYLKGLHGYYLYKNQLWLEERCLNLLFHDKAKDIMSHCQKEGLLLETRRKHFIYNQNEIVVLVSDQYIQELISNPEIKVRFNRELTEARKEMLLFVDKSVCNIN